MYILTDPLLELQSQLKKNSELPEEIFKYLVSATENLKYAMNFPYSERDPNRSAPPSTYGKLVF